MTLLDAHSDLERFGVTIRSATEPFDTGTAIGKFLFQLLASLAELEKSTITERMTMGRDRVAKQGKWTGGPVPFGYDVGADDCLVPSVRDAAGRSESDVAREIIERIANGSSCVVEARRLNALGVPAVKRWSSGTERVASGQWHPDRVLYMVRNSAYVGEHVLHGKNGAVDRPTPALVDRATWDRAQAQLVKNGWWLPETPGASTCCVAWSSAPVAAATWARVVATSSRAESSAGTAASLRLAQAGSTRAAMPSPSRRPTLSKPSGTIAAPGPRIRARRSEMLSASYANGLARRPRSRANGASFSRTSPPRTRSVSG